MGKPITVMVLLAFLLTACASQQKAEILDFDTAPLFGMIYDKDNQPCAGVAINIDGTQGPVTDIRGRFILPDVTRGAHTVVAQKEGFEKLTVTVQFLNKTDVLYLNIMSFSELLTKAENALKEMKWDDADAFLSRAEKLDSEDSIFLYLRAVLAYKTGEYPKAVEYLNGILTKGVKEAYVYLFLADIYQNNLNEPQKAIDNLEVYLSRRADPDVQKRLEALKGGAGG
jgi:tetratricopeptide (TPR) repeat protein